MRKIASTLLEIIAVLLLGGLLGATLVRFAPGFGTDEQEMDSRLNHDSMQALRQANAPGESLSGFYLHHLQRMLHGDLGYSKTLQEPVRQLLAERLPDTLKSVALGLLFGWSLGLGLAATATLFRSWSLNIFTGLLASTMLSVPAAVLALLLVMAHAPGRLVLGFVVFPKVFRYSRNLLSQVADQPHVVTAWAKGLGRLQVFKKHIVPIITPQLLALLGVSVSLAFAAAIPMEVVCDLPGVGQLAWKAALGRDFELLVDLTMLVTTITLAANSAAGWMTPRLIVREP